MNFNYLLIDLMILIVGLATDMLVYSIIVPVMPFQLQKLGYEGVSGLTGWLLFAFSGGLFIATFPAAMFSERYEARQSPLVLGVIILVGSQIMLMEAPVYWLMVLARVLQGVGSTMIWVVGMALLCDAAPLDLVARQIGFAMTGFSLGVLVGPPVGGALYERFGFRGPFIFGMIMAVLDLIARLVVVERKEALKWGIDPQRQHQKPESSPPNGSAEPALPTGAVNDGEKRTVERELGEGARTAPDEKEQKRKSEAKGKPLSLMSVLGRLCKSPRAVNTSVIILIYGIVYAAQEPTLPLHVQAVWNFESKDTGLVFLAGVIPTLFSTPITGYISDRFGTAWITIICLLFSLPWWVVLVVELNVALFVASFAIENFFTSGVISPLMAELAAVAREEEGIGYAHVYAAFNLAYGIGSAIGPIIGGQIFDHVRRGWMVICLLSVGLVALGMVMSFIYTGDEPIAKQLVRALRGRRR
ncbi:hypothetical protein VKT23_002990 [Stygiomarasmius scandens]|uniref:Major facilitator superfamily (MFS) profile domain-containing protein n=1 Tax=Marasmiellus scandens TaxID=2682957 RepID=A0ABR1K088_9AGAR